VTSTPAGDARRDAGTVPGRGTRVVVGILTLAIGLGLFALWFQWRQTRRCLDFYGTETARLIQRATRVEVWERAAGTAATVGPGTASPSFERYDVSTARGLVHLRRGLVEDANLDWSRLDEREVSAPAWDLALAFFEPAGAVTPAAVLLVERAADGGFLSVEGRPGRVGLGRLASGIERWWRSVRDDAVPRARDR
jgi:hypothetical protein